jgi:DNA replication and repair protein RecF
VLKDTSEMLEYILVREDTASKKVVRHNGVAIPLTQVYGLLPTVLFSPEFITLIDGSPQERRRFLDALLSQSDVGYIDALLTYRKVLRERHFLLLRLQTGLGNEDEIEFWDNELVTTGEEIVRHREQVIVTLNELIIPLYPQFLDKNPEETLCLVYKPSVEVGAFAKRLKASRRYDIKTATTAVGPHRDEMIFLMQNRDVTLFASRGEMRRAILVTKLAEALYLQKKTQKEPILLLDDVFSEFDAIRRERILQSIAPYRSIITTTDASFVAHNNLPDIALHELPLHNNTKEAP